MKKLKSVKAWAVVNVFNRMTPVSEMTEAPILFGLKRLAVEFRAGKERVVPVLITPKHKHTSGVRANRAPQRDIRK